MTEDEAKTKWCFAAVASHTNPRMGFEAPEQLGDAPPYTKTFPCIASACMAWRRDAAEQRRGPIVERVCALPGSSRPTGDDWGYEASDPNRASAGGDWVRFETVTEHLTGYCGLAGAPQ